MDTILSHDSTGAESLPNSKSKSNKSRDVSTYEWSSCDQMMWYVAYRLLLICHIGQNAYDNSASKHTMERNVLTVYT